jgi:hypothetical protein
MPFHVLIQRSDFLVRWRIQMTSRRIASGPKHLFGSNGFVTFILFSVLFMDNIVLYIFLLGIEASLEFFDVAIPCQSESH